MSVEKKCFSAWDLISLGSSHAGSLFINEEQKKTVCDVTDASVTHACLVYDVSHIDCWAQRGSTHGCDFATFKYKLLAKRMNK